MTNTNIEIFNSEEFGSVRVLCQGNVESDGEITYLPWYMYIFICRREVPKGLVYKVDISALNQ